MSRTDVLVYDPRGPGELIGRLRDVAERYDLTVSAARDEAEASERIGSTEILISTNAFPMHLLPDARALRWIHVQGAGVNRWIDADLPEGVRLSRTTGSFGPRMAEYALGYVLAVAKRIPETLEAQRAHRWQPRDLATVRGTTLGVAGLGDIGREVARSGRALGMRIVGLARTRREDDVADAVYAPSDVEAFCAASDYIVVILPLTPATRGLFGADAFAAMKPTAWLINMGRGPLVDEAALLTALDEGDLAGAVLDVFATEPLPRDHPFWDRSDVLVTPHHSGTTLVEEVAEALRSNLPLFLNGRPLVNEVILERGY